MIRFDEQSASTDAIMQAFDNAAMSATVDEDGDVYVSDGADFPFWVKLLTDRDMVCFSTYRLLAPDVDLATAAERANRASAAVVLPQFFAVEVGESRRFCGMYYLPYTYGIDPRLIVRMGRRFAGAYRVGLREFDEGMLH